METVYNIIEFLLPFSWAKYDFIKNAFLAILIISPLFGIMGTMIVNNKMAFFSDSIGHSALTGIAIGVILGVSNPTISMIIFAILFGICLNRISRKKMASTDTIISVFTSTAIAVGLLLLAKNGGINQYSNYLVGDILNIAPKEILMLLIAFIATFLFWYFCFNKFLAVSTNRILAKSKGINANLIEDIFVVLVSIVVMLSIKWVGVFLINALIIIPAAASRCISKNMKQYHMWSVIFSYFAGILGLILSYYYKLATGSTIVIILAIIFFITYFIGKKK